MAVTESFRAEVDRETLKFRGLSPKPFNYFNKRTAAIIARNAGVAYLFGKIPFIKKISQE